MSHVSVVIPAHNAERFLVEALDSVFSQGLVDPEVVVVDDGSTDGTARVAESYGRGVRLLRQPASGSGRARNAGLDASSGALIAFLDADDIWVADKSRQQLALLEQDSELGFVFSDMLAFRDDRDSEQTYFEERGYDGLCRPSSIFLHDIVSTPTVILRRSCLAAVGQFDESLAIGQDTDLWLRLALEYPFAVVKRPLVRRRLHADNITRDQRLLTRCSREIWSRYLERCIDREPEMRHALEQTLSIKQWEHHFVEGCSLLREGRPADARRHLGAAVRELPSRLRAYLFYALTFLGPAGRTLRRSR